MVRSPWTLVAALTGLAAALGVTRLDDRSIWLDEGTSIWYALHTWRALLDSIATLEPNMGLYYELLWMWRHAFGSSVFAMRGLSVVFAALTIPSVYVLGRRVFGQRAGLVAAVLMATSAFLLTYAQEARSYALVALLATISSTFFYAQLTTPTRANAVGYVLASTLGMYTHLFMAFVLLSHAGYLAATKSRDALRRRWLVEYGAIVLAVLPLAYLAHRAYAPASNWLPAPSRSLLSATLETLTGSDLLLRVYGAVGLAGLVLAVRRPDLRVRLAFPATWLVVPVAVAFALSVLEPIVLPKYLIVSLPALAIMSGGIIAHARRAVGAVLLAVLLACSVPALRDWYRRPPVTDWKAVTEYVVDNARAGDGLILTRVTYPFEYYAARSEHTPLTPTSDTSLPTLRRIDNPRVWLVFANAGGAPRWVPASLGGGAYRKGEHRAFGAVHVQLMERKAG